MKVAILMSTYNGQKYLDKQLLSLYNQTVREMITVYIRDDGSCDKTFEIVNSWKDKLDIVFYKADNAGPAKSFWELLMNEEISADYYAFCDQDDIWDSDKIEKAIKRLTNNVHLYICNCRLIDQNDTVLKEIRCEQPPEISYPRLFLSGVTQGCSMVFTRELRLYLMKMAISCIPMHDIILMLYAMNFGEVFWDQSPCFSYRVHADNVVAKKNKKGIKRIKTVYWNWKNSSRNSMSDVAMEMLQNTDIKGENREFLEKVAYYKKHRFRLIRSMGNIQVSNSIARSFVIRVLLKLY